MSDESVTTPGNGRRVQVRKSTPGAFTDAKKRIVLDQLAACCNVTRAAAAAGVSTNTVNYHRRRDPVFAAACAEAIEAGYEALESAMLERARFGPGEAGALYPPGDSEVPGAETVDSALALHLLSLRHKAPGRRTGDAGPRPQRVSEKALTQSILEKLALLDARLETGKGPAIRRLREDGARKGMGEGKARKKKVDPGLRRGDDLVRGSGDGE